MGFFDFLLGKRKADVPCERNESNGSDDKSEADVLRENIEFFKKILDEAPCVVVKALLVVMKSTQNASMYVKIVPTSDALSKVIVSGNQFELGRISAGLLREADQIVGTLMKAGDFSLFYFSANEGVGVDAKRPKTSAFPNLSVVPIPPYAPASAGVAPCINGAAGGAPTLPRVAPGTNGAAGGAPTLPRVEPDGSGAAGGAPTPPRVAPGTNGAASSAVSKPRGVFNKMKPYRGMITLELDGKTYDLSGQAAWYIGSLLFHRMCAENGLSAAAAMDAKSSNKTLVKGLFSENALAAFVAKNNPVNYGQ